MMQLTRHFQSGCTQTGHPVSSRWASGLLLVTVAVLLWGVQTPLTRNTYLLVDPMWMGMIRVGATWLVLPLLLLAIEGRRSLRFEGRFLSLAWHGAMGLSGFNLFFFIGLIYTTPERAAVILALQPTLIAALLWATRGIRPAPVTLACTVAAFAGAALVVTQGGSVAAGSASWVGDCAFLLAALCWVGYSLGANDYPGWSALRYTAMSGLMGPVLFACVFVFAAASGLAPAPDASALLSVAPEAAYLVLGVAVVALLAWNAAIPRLGPLNASLCATATPLVTLGWRAMEGHRFTAGELGGAALVIGALVVNNLAQRHRLAGAVTGR